jgi:hypothetical protein
MLWSLAHLRNEKRRCNRITGGAAPDTEAEWLRVDQLPIPPTGVETAHRNCANQVAAFRLITLAGVNELVSQKWIDERRQRNRIRRRTQVGENPLRSAFRNQIIGFASGIKHNEMESVAIGRNVWWQEMKLNARIRAIIGCEDDCGAMLSAMHQAMEPRDASFGLCMPCMHPLWMQMHFIALCHRPTHLHDLTCSSQSAVACMH